MTILLLRIGWNSNGWRAPTGELLNREASYVGKNGFGHEDWNFATTDLVGDRILGYVRYQPADRRVDLRLPVDIWFFSREPGGPRYLVGRYKDASFLDSEARASARRQFGKSGVLEKRIDELAALNLPFIKTREQARHNLFEDFSSNLAVLAENIQVFEPRVELTSALIGGRDPRWLNRYGTPIELSEAPPLKDSVRPIRRPPLAATDPEQLPEEAYLRFTVAQMRVIKRMHNLLSNRFREWLVAAGAQQVCAEENRVDMTCEWGGAPCLFELKTTSGQSLRLALRDAMGQLLEYAYYPGRVVPQHLAIVLDAAPSSEEVNWIRHLNAVMPKIELFWLVGKSVRTAALTHHPIGDIAR